MLCVIETFGSNLSHRPNFLQQLFKADLVIRFDRAQRAVGSFAETELATSTFTGCTFQMSRQYS